MIWVALIATALAFFGALVVIAFRSRSAIRELRTELADVRSVRADTETLTSAVEATQTRVVEQHADLDERLRAQRKAIQMSRSQTKALRQATERQLANQAGQLRAARESAEAERGRLVETRTHLDDARLRAKQQTRELEAHAKRHNGLALVVDELRRSHAETRSIARAAEAKADRERNERIVMAAREADARGPETNSVVLLMTIHRSGSTLLFDILRSHPHARFEHTFRLWSALELKGRRYPVALSDGAAAIVPIEAADGIGSLIPPLSKPAAGVGPPVTAIEKAHPQFYDFDAAAFAERIVATRAELGIPIELVYGIREPVESMWSMVEYQQRDPNWYQFLEPVDVPDFIDRSITSLEELRKLIPGPVVDYSDLHSGSDVLADIGRAMGDTDTQAWLDFAFETHGRGRRQSTQTGPFVGSDEPTRSDVGPDGCWSDSTDTLGHARAVYSRLRKL